MRRLIFLLLVLPAVAHAQDSLGLGETPPFENYTKGLTLKFLAGRVGISTKVRSNADGVDEVNYLPNAPGLFGGSVAYNGLGITAVFKTPDYESDPETYGTSKLFNLALDLTGRKWVGGITYRSIKGLYLENAENFEGASLPPVKRLHPQMQIREVRGSFTWIKNGANYSYRAAFTQSEVQKRSKGSFLLEGRLGYLSASTDSSMVPLKARADYEGVNDFVSSDAVALAALPGYGVNLVAFRRLCFSLLVQLGPSLQYQTFESLQGDVKRQWAVGFATRYGFAVNFHRPRWFVGFEATGQNTSLRVTEDIRWETQLLAAELHLGYRFPHVVLFKNSGLLRKFGPTRKWLDGE